MNCCAPGCSVQWKKNSGEISFHRFPSDNQLRSTWIKNIGLSTQSETKKLTEKRVCSQHFTENQIIRKAKRTYLCPGAIPNLKLMPSINNDTPAVRTETDFSERLEVSKNADALANTNVLISADDQIPSLEHFSKICRVCLKELPLISLPKSEHFAFYERLTDLEVDLLDEFPKNICVDCHNELEKASLFVSKAQQSWKQLKVQKTVISESRDEGILEEPENGEMPKPPKTIQINETTFGGTQKIVPKGRRLIIPLRNYAGKRMNPFSDKPRNKPKRQRECQFCHEKIRSFVIHYKENKECRYKAKNCLVCRATFSTRTKLNYHMISHSGDSNYQCWLCLRRFKHWANLKRHLLCHETAKAFKCKICEKGFSTSTTRNEHMNRHLGFTPHKCCQCEESFSSSFLKLRHIERFHKIREPKCCDICQKMCPSKEALTNHRHYHNRCSKKAPKYTT